MRQSETDEQYYEENIRRRRRHIFEREFDVVPRESEQDRCTDRQTARQREREVLNPFKNYLNLLRVMLLRVWIWLVGWLHCILFAD